MFSLYHKLIDNGAILGLLEKSMPSIAVGETSNGRTEEPARQQILNSFKVKTTGLILRHTGPLFTSNFQNERQCLCKLPNPPRHTSPRRYLHLLRESP